MIVQGRKEHGLAGRDAEISRAVGFHRHRAENGLGLEAGVDTYLDVPGKGEQMAFVSLNDPEMAHPVPTTTWDCWLLPQSSSATKKRPLGTGSPGNSAAPWTAKPVQIKQLTA